MKKKKPLAKVSLNNLEEDKAKETPTHFSTGDYVIDEHGHHNKKSGDPKGDARLATPIFKTGSDDEENCETHNDKCITKEKMEFVQYLGKGAGGIVHLVKHKDTNEYMALKEISIAGEADEKMIAVEFNTGYKHHSEHIIKFYGAYFDKGKINMAIEYMNMGTLTDLYDVIGKLKENILGTVAHQCLQGLDYFHTKMKMAHRDIKPANILVNSDGQVKIADFGISRDLGNSLQSTTWVGTVKYMSPERMSGEEYSFGGDIWALGVSILECALGKYPYSATTMWDLKSEIEKSTLPDMPSSFSPEFGDFIEMCLKKKSGDRKTAKQLLQHPWVQKFDNPKIEPFKKWLQIYAQMKMKKEGKK